MPHNHARRHTPTVPPATRKRIGVAAIAFILVFGVVSARMAQIAMSGGPDVMALANGGHTLSKDRPDILDRNGLIMATDLEVASVYADARKVWDVEETAQALNSVFPELNVAELKTKLETKAAFVWIKRDITPRQHAAVRDLGLPGIEFEKELKRVYPNGRDAAHVLGFVNMDNRGGAGIEQALDTTLANRTNGAEPVKLSIDLRVQHVVEDELSKAIEEFSAIGGTGLVMDVATGEVLAMVSLPDYDPNHISDEPEQNRFNRATLGVYEMGSTFKAFNTAMALDGGVSVNDRFDARAPIKIGRFTIKDYHPMGRALSVEEIFEHSSNIGSANMARKFGAEYQKAFLKSLGQLDPMPLELPERGAPLWPSNWSEVSMLTISFGHGIAVSPMHVITGVSALANGGTFVEPTMLMRDPNAPLPAHRIVSERTSEKMNQLFRMVVERGTARKADVPGYQVGGKTGTAEKAKGRGYAEKALLSSFIGVFPTKEPRYAVLIIIDEPKGTKETSGFATGGWTAAPVTSRVVARIAPMLGVPPQFVPGAHPMVASAEDEAKALSQDH